MTTEEIARKLGEVNATIRDKHREMGKIWAESPGRVEQLRTDVAALKKQAAALDAALTQRQAKMN